MKTPTRSQALRLRVLADGYIVAAPKRGEWVGMLRAGWVERIDRTSPRGGLLPPLRITGAGLAALAASPESKSEESTCSGTISTLPVLSAVANGKPLPRLRSVGSGKLPRRRGSRRPNCSSGSPSPIRPLPPVATGPLPTGDGVADLLDELWQGLEGRAAARETRGGYSAGNRCWSCRRFVSGPTVTCSHCGQPHGGIHHQAYAAR